MTQLTPFQKWLQAIEEIAPEHRDDYIRFTLRFENTPVFKRQVIQYATGFHLDFVTPFKMDKSGDRTVSKLRLILTALSLHHGLPHQVREEMEYALHYIAEYQKINWFTLYYIVDFVKNGTKAGNPLRALTNLLDIFLKEANDESFYHFLTCTYEERFTREMYEKYWQHPYISDEGFLLLNKKGEKVDEAKDISEAPESIYKGPRDLSKIKKRSDDVHTHRKGS